MRSVAGRGGSHRDEVSIAGGRPVGELLTGRRLDLVVVLSNKAEERLDIEVSLVGEMRHVGLYRIDVSATFLSQIEIPSLGQVGDDALSGVLGDVQEISDLPDSDPRIANDQQECIAVVGEESELWYSRHHLAPFSVVKTRSSHSSIKSGFAKFRD